MAREKQTQIIVVRPRRKRLKTALFLGGAGALGATAFFKRKQIGKLFRLGRGVSRVADVSTTPLFSFGRIPGTKIKGRFTFSALDLISPFFGVVQRLF